jgi:PTH1 family peptidyl-tRNA hydrolase
VKYIIGLGNPGLEYSHTKHNMGFEVVKSLAKENDIEIDQKRHFSLIGKGRIGREDVTLVLPQTFMNLSGNAVGELFSHEATKVEDILVVFDDINLELGKIRLKKQGSFGGHHGVSSIIQTVGTDIFARLKVGIATDVHKGDITRYVLSPFKRHEKRNVDHSIALAVECVTCMLSDGIDTAMNRFNKRKAGTS